jgi:hypothetical protein
VGCREERACERGRISIEKQMTIGRTKMPDRGSTRHSARVDEQMDAEVASLTHGAPVEARAEEWRQMEPAAEGEPNPDGMTSVDEIEFRSLLATSLRPSAFPGASRPWVRRSTHLPMSRQLSRRRRARLPKRPNRRLRLSQDARSASGSRPPALRSTQPAPAYE